jgi:hypothetical protein
VNGVLVVKSFPAKLHRALKMQAAADDEQIREIVIAAVSAELARRERAEAKRAGERP